MTIYGSLIKFWQERFYATTNYDGFMKWICTGTLPRRVFLDKYKKLEPIETMPDHEKKEMKKYVIALFPEKSTQEKLECCKIIYCFGTLL